MFTNKTFFGFSQFKVMFVLVVFCVALINDGFPFKTSERIYKSPNNDKFQVNFMNRIEPNKSLTRKNVKKIEKEHLNSRNTNKSFCVNGIEHFEINHKGQEWEKVNQIEKDFKNMLAMRGVEYIYKRDMFWRTWRSPAYFKEYKEPVFYKCSNIINTMCAGCHGGGFWVIDEDELSCPFDVFSMKSSNELCVVNYKQMNKIDEPCPTILDLVDLTVSCDNPIITKYRVTKGISKISERNKSDICRGREFCEISTVYRIYEDYILFRIVSSTNDIVYSKIMKNDKKIYVCLSACGRIDSLTKTIKKSAEKEFNDDVKKRNNTLLKKRSNIKKHSHKLTTESPCSKLQTAILDYDEENYDYLI